MIDINFDSNVSTDTISAKDLKIAHNGLLLQKHVEEGLSHGLELLHRANSRVYCWYKVMSCGHEMFLHLEAIRKLIGIYKCPVCIRTRLGEEAKKVGLTLLDSRENCKSKAQNNYLFPCGHIIAHRSSNIKEFGKNKRSKLGKEVEDTLLYPCNSCKEINKVKDAASINLEYIGKTNGKDLHLYKGKCGHSFTKSLQAIKQKRNLCPICEVSHINSMSSIYLLEIITRYDN